MLNAVSLTECASWPSSVSCPGGRGRRRDLLKIAVRSLLPDRLRLLGKLVKLVHRLLRVVTPAVQQPEDDTGTEAGDTQPSVHPEQLGVDGGGREGYGEGRPERGRRQEQRHDERVHARGGLGEGVLEAGDAGEDLGEADEQVRGGLDGDVDVVGRVGAVLLQGGGAGGDLLVARAGVVDHLLHSGRVRHGAAGEHEAPEDARYREHLEAQLVQRRVEDAVADGNEDDDRDRVPVLPSGRSGFRGGSSGRLAR